MCTSMVTQIAMNIGCLEMANLTYIEGDVPVLSLDHFVHVHILHEEPNHSLSMLYGHNADQLPNSALWLYSCESLTLQFDQMGEAHHSFIGSPHTRGRAHIEAAQQATTTPQAHPQEPQWDTGYRGDYSGHHEGNSYHPSHSYPESSLRAGTSTSARYPDWYFPLERYINYGTDQAEHVVEGIRWLERPMGDFAHMQMEMQASINSQTSMMHNLFGRFRINSDA
jgi:hypothetical protein